MVREKSRLFTFGCSFTDYNWDTWANLLAENYTDHVQHGRPGAGNQYIYFRVMQEIYLQNISPEDTVVIMWTSILRYDLYKFQNLGWTTSGNVVGTYPDEVVDKIFDAVGWYKRDTALIHGVRLALDTIGCKYEFLSMMPLAEPVRALGIDLKEIEVSKEYTPVDSISGSEHHIYDWFTDTLDMVKPSVYEIVFNNDWYSRAEEHYGSNTIHYNKIRGESWPSIEDLSENCVKKEDMSEEVQEEMCLLFKVRDVQDIIDKKLYTCGDMHPTTEMHREYLNTVLPDWETW